MTQIGTSHFYDAHSLIEDFLNLLITKFYIQLINAHKDYKKAQSSKIFFKTYDQHLAQTTHLLRNIAKNFNNITLQDLSFFLQSTIHDH